MRAIGEPLSAEQRIALVAAARSYVGVRWRHQGRDRRGVDCVGLVATALHDIGIDVADMVGYGRVPYRGALERMVETNLGEPVTGDPQVGDVAIFDAGGNAPNHVGILGDYPHGGLSLIHAYAVNRAVVEMRLDDDWRCKIIGVYRP